MATFEQIDPPYSMLERDYILNGEQPAAITAGGSQEIDLDPDALYRGIDLQLTFSYTAGTGGTLRQDNPFSLIREIQVIAGNGDIIQRLSGYEAYLIAQLARGNSKVIDFTRVPASTTSVTNGRAVIPLDFQFLHLQPSHFGLIPARYLTNFKLRFDYASSLTDAIATGLGGSPAVTASIQVFKRLVRHSSPAPQGYGTRVLQVSPVAIASTSNAFPVKVEAGVRYAGFLVVNRDTSSATLSDAAGFTGNVAIYLDSGTLRYKVSSTLARQILRQQFPINYPGTSTQIDLTGCFFLDVAGLAADDNDSLVTLAQALDATDSREVRLEFDVTAGTSTSMRVLPIRVRAVQQSASAMSLPVR